MEHLARDVNDFPTAKLAFSVLTRMVATWGGPDVVPVPKNPRAPSVSEMESKAKLEGFDHFMITRFSPLSWAIPSNPSFDPKDAQGKQVLSEAAGLQKAIYNKTGEEYLVYLRNVELGGMGMDAATVETYLAAITTMDLKAFQQFFKVSYPNTPILAQADPLTESCSKKRHLDGHIQIFFMSASDAFPAKLSMD